jgi:C-terminal processing protease CtpA/Prc
LALDGLGARRVAGSAQLPQFLADETRFERQFELSFAGGKSAGILKLGTFFWPEERQVLDFTHDAFARLHAARTKTLVIDLRDNGGGNDDEWVEGLMPYIAGKPFRIASNYRKRAVVSDPARGEVAGSVVDGRIGDWFPPDPKNPLRFHGKVYVLVGPGTFSSAVTLASVVQDFGFGRVVGPRDCVRAGVSGGARRTTLTHSGLIVVAPRFVLTRPSGAREPALFTPDLAELPEL